MPDAAVTVLQSGMLNVAMAAGTLKDEPGVSAGADFWGGMKSSPTLLLMLAPLLLVLAAGIALLVAVDARRVVAGRLADGDL